MKNKGYSLLQKRLCYVKLTSLWIPYEIADANRRWEIKSQLLVNLDRTTQKIIFLSASYFVAGWN